MRRTAQATTLLIVFASVGCGDSAGPSPTATAPSATMVRIVGTVRTIEFKPVSGARLEIIEGVLAGQSAMSDDAGRFAFPEMKTSTASVTIQITKDGYESVTIPLNVGRNSNLDLILAPLGLPSLEGEYTVTFSTTSCGQLPPPTRERTYVARVRPERIVNPSRYTVELSGANFHPGYQTFTVTVGSDTARFFVSSWDTVLWWLEDHPLFERLDPTTHLGLSGSAIASLVPPHTSFTATFKGSFSYCEATREPTVAPQFPLTCSVPPVECTSDNHELSFRRR